MADTGRLQQLPVFPGEARKNDALFVFGAMQRHPFVFTYEQQSIEIVGGPSFKPAAEIDIDNCKSCNVPLLARRGGGGTVILAPGMLITVIVDRRARSTDPHAIFDRIHNAMIRILADLNIPGVERRGLSDLAIRDRKILGSSLYLGTRPFLYYYQSSLIVDADLSLISRYLKHPPKEPDYRIGRSHEHFVTSLAAQNFNVTAGRIAEHFRNKLPAALENR